MESVIKAIYSGEPISVEALPFPDEPEYKELAAEIEKAEDSFMEKLSEVQKEKYRALQSFKETLTGMDMDRMFCYAFRVGFKLATEIFQE